ncbi:hypothetical protein B0H66DRAFT_570710 [Apodospora peruviana]|uniref:Secreted protein n=1 Tax=Apodospora peruviana TaxID=516989 RepID=A0AAE0LYL7_9PEZI|nr:hypothetical protein B0H66DRAFT_570710 [Apodospora peruviana]
MSRRPSPFRRLLCLGCFCATPGCRTTPPSINSSKANFPRQLPLVYCPALFIFHVSAFPHRQCRVKSNSFIQVLF